MASPKQAGELADIQQRTARALDPGPRAEAIAQPPDQAPVLSCGGGWGQAGGERLHVVIEPFGILAQVRQCGNQDRRDPGSRGEPAAGARHVQELRDAQAEPVEVPEEHPGLAEQPPVRRRVQVTRREGVGHQQGKELRQAENPRVQPEHVRQHRRAAPAGGNDEDTRPRRPRISDHLDIAPLTKPAILTVAGPRRGPRQPADASRHDAPPGRKPAAGRHHRRLPAPAGIAGQPGASQGLPGSFPACLLPAAEIAR